MSEISIEGRELEYCVTEKKSRHDLKKRNNVKKTNKCKKRSHCNEYIPRKKYRLRFMF